MNTEVYSLVGSILLTCLAAVGVYHLAGLVAPPLVAAAVAVVVVYLNYRLICLHRPKGWK
jgi:Flp pilus assembly protein TadB